MCHSHPNQLGKLGLEALRHEPGILPTLGHIRKELKDDDARIIAVTGLLVIYDPNLKPLTILRVVHAARNPRHISPRP